MAIPLEDNYDDIIGKAQRGLRISDSQLAEMSGLTAGQIRMLREGEIDEEAILRIAPALSLDARALLASARQEWKPVDLQGLDGLSQFVTPYEDITVNAYLVWDRASREAVAFDTGADCVEMLACLESEQLTVKLILLTHEHTDHIADLRRLRERTRAPVFISERETAEGAQPIAEGKKFVVGKLQIEARLTSGHSVGGMTYVVDGLARPVAIVGDSLFAGSMGGGMISYEDAFRNNLEKILTLPDDTVLCPGHGPLTTVGEEKRHNPFFAAKFK
ncbi:MAG: MBL fold metallo-hydrolase [Chthoniobacterales bacterium]